VSARTRQKNPIVHLAKIQSHDAPELPVKGGSEYAPVAQQGQRRQENGRVVDEREESKHHRLTLCNIGFHLTTPRRRRTTSRRVKVGS
jgi:hypothetical protein